MTDFVRNWNEDMLSIPVAPLGFIAMPGCEDLGKKVNQWLMKWYEAQENENGVPLFSIKGQDKEDFLIDVSLPRFGTGEAKGLIRSSVRGYDIFILTDVLAHNVTYRMYGQEVPMSPDDHFQDLKRIIAAIGGKARRINVIMPFLYESRQHRRTSRESLDCALALQELHNLGVSNILTFDAHDPRVQNAIPTGGFESVMPSYQILKALFKNQKDLHLDPDHMMIVSPDEGAIGRNIYYSALLGINMGVFYKRRDFTRMVDGMNPIVAHEYLGESVEGKDIFVSDDMISSGGSILDLARELKKRKANRIFASSTFAMFTNGLDAFHKAYEEGLITRIISTNLSYRRPDLAKAEWFIEADMSKYIAFLLASINHDRSISSLINPSKRINKLLERYHKEQAELSILNQ